MDLIKRLGTQKKKFKLQFFIGKLKFNTFLPGKVYIVLRRGNHKVKTQQKLQLPKDSILNFNKEILELEVTLYFDEKENKYQEKPGQMDIVMVDQKSSKMLLGIVSFDVGQYANIGQESIKEKKQIEQTPKNFSGYIEYNVFIKYIGEGSESSLDKVADFFFGKSKQPQSEKKINSKTDISSNQKIYDDQKTGSARDVSKTQAKQGKTVDFYQIEQSKLPKQKNYVTTAKAREGSHEFMEDNDELARNFYLDDADNDFDREKRMKKSKKLLNSVEKNRNNREKAGSDQMIADRDSNKKQKGKQKQKAKEKTPDPMTYYSSHQTIQALKAEVTDYKLKYEQLQCQLGQQQHLNNIIRKQNDQFQKQLAQSKEELRQKDQEIQEQKTFQTKQLPQGDNQLKQKLQLLQKQLKKAQKEKNQVIVQNSKLKEKYKQDFKKYEQLLQQKQSDQQSKADSVKADAHKLKQECSQYRQTIEKLTKQRNDKHQQLVKQKNENKCMQEQLTEVKTSLSKIKLKICNKLNEVLVKDELGIVDILMDLNRDD